MIPLLSGKQTGRMNWFNGTLSVNLSNAMSLSITLNIDCREMDREMYRVSGEGLLVHASCSPNVTFTINHILKEFGKNN